MLLEDICQYLVDNSLATGHGIDVFTDFQPEDPDNIICLQEYRGDPVSPYTDVVHRSVQVSVRNKSAAEAKRIANSLCSSFRLSDEVQRIDFTATRWGQVHIRQTPYKIKQDDRDRTIYGFNIGITTNTD